MNLVLTRYTKGPDASLGLLFVDGEFECYTLEDPTRVDKIKGITCIPLGRYRLDLRTAGGMHTRYADSYKEMHKGMIWLRNVPNFEWVYVHIGNTPGNTDGCILVGNKTEKKGTVGSSVDTYKDVYPKIADAILNDFAQIEIASM